MFCSSCGSGEQISAGSFTVTTSTPAAAEWARLHVYACYLVTSSARPSTIWSEVRSKRAWLHSHSPPARLVPLLSKREVFSVTLHQQLLHKGERGIVATNSRVQTGSQPTRTDRIATNSYTRNVLREGECIFLDPSQLCHTPTMSWDEEPDAGRPRTLRPTHCHTKHGAIKRAIFRSGGPLHPSSPKISYSLSYCIGLAELSWFGRGRLATLVERS